MSQGKRGSLFWRKGEAIRVRLMSAGWVEQNPSGKRVRHFGQERWFHIAKGRSWPEDCVRGDCPTCARGFHAARRWVDTIYVVEGDVERPVQVWFSPSADRALAAWVDAEEDASRDPTASKIDVRFEGGTKWTVTQVRVP